MSDERADGARLPGPVSTDCMTRGCLEMQAATRSAELGTIDELQCALARAQAILRGWIALHEHGEEPKPHTKAECDQWQFVDCKLANLSRTALEAAALARLDAPEGV